MNLNSHRVNQFVLYITVLGTFNRSAQTFESWSIVYRLSHVLTDSLLSEAPKDRLLLESLERPPLYITPCAEFLGKGDTEIRSPLAALHRVSMSLRCAV